MPVFELTIAKPRSADYDKWADTVWMKKQHLFDEWNTRRSYSSRERLTKEEQSIRRGVVVSMLESGPKSVTELMLDIDDDSLFSTDKQIYEVLRSLKNEGVVVVLEMRCSSNSRKWQLSSSA